MSVARLWRLGCSAPPRIARRSCARGRWSSGEDGRVDLVQEKLPNLVSEMRNEERKRKVRERRHGAATVHRKWSFLPTAMAG